ncbi:Transcriptional regulator WhiB [Streptomyces violaceorubidus]
MTELVQQLLVDDADEELGWQERALCAQTDPESFFPEKGGSTREAKKVCLACEVRSECLEYALANDERFGISGRPVRAGAPPAEEGGGLTRRGLTQRQKRPQEQRETARRRWVVHRRRAAPVSSR